MTNSAQIHRGSAGRGESVGSARLTSSRYLIERSLGEQPAGWFHVAVDTLQGGRVTLFMPRTEPGTADALAASLQREVDRLATLSQTGYCTLRDTGLNESGRLFVAVDRPQGTPLSVLLRERDRLSIDQALSVAIQLCDLVDRAHSAGLYPSPLAPDSVIVDPLAGGRLRICLVDLGLSRGVYGHAVQGPPLPARFVAPQMRAGQPADPRDDVFSLTALLHLMVFGVAPPPMSAHGPADGTGWPLVPDDGRGLDRRLESCLHTVLLKGLATERDDRFAQVSLLSRALVGLRQLMSITAPAFELLAATRGRLGRRGDALDVAPPRPGLERAVEARERIKEVVDQAGAEGANLTSLDERRRALGGRLQVVRPQGGRKP